MPRPNIILFFSDQQRWDTVGCYGQPLNVAPNLDRMAYDLDADPFLRNNLIRRAGPLDPPQYADVRAALAVTLKRRMAEAGETVPEILPSV